MSDPRPITKTFEYGTRSLCTMGFDGECTAYLWGAGGGAGGADANTFGGAGSPGAHSYTTFTFSKGDIIEVIVGEGGTGGGSNKGSAVAGIGGRARLSIDQTKSFNGGDGSPAGPSPYSGGGGGGGGATVVLKNNNVVCAAGGGGGGGGAGNDGNSAGPFNRRTASIDKNANSSTAAAVASSALAIPITPTNPINFYAIDLTQPGQNILGVHASINNYNTFSNPLKVLAQPPDGSTRVGVFGKVPVVAGSSTRTITTNVRKILTSYSSLVYYVNRGTETGWGQTPDKGEDLKLEYSADNTTWVTLDTVGISATADTWIQRTITIPAGAKVAGGVFLRFSQNNSYSTNPQADTWAFTSVITNPTTMTSPVPANNAVGFDCRGESAQSKSGDGGGGGGGGGGFPGGQGGAVNPGDTSGFAGQTGGSFPYNTSFVESINCGPVDSTAWSVHMRQYAIWPLSQAGVGTFTISRIFDAPYTGEFKFLFNVDNSGQLFIDGVEVTSTNNFASNPTPLNYSLNKGPHVLKFVVTNTGGPGGFALVIQDNKGGIMWDTRQYASIDVPGGNSKYYLSDRGRGGVPSGGNGKNGFAALVFQPKADYATVSAVKIAGSWRQVTAGYVKVAGSWRNIKAAYVKRRGKWYQIASTGDTSSASFTSDSESIGKSNRPYSANS